MDAISHERAMCQSMLDSSWQKRAEMGSCASSEARWDEQCVSIRGTMGINKHPCFQEKNKYSCIFSWEILNLVEVNLQQ